MFPQTIESLKGSALHTSISTGASAPGEYDSENAQVIPCRIIFQSDSENMENYKINLMWITGPCHENCLQSVTGS